MIFRCPHCGSQKFKIIDDNAILCEYCDQESNFSVDEIENRNENKAFIKELQERYNAKLAELYKEKGQAHAYMLYCKKLANPKRLLVAFGISLAITIMLLLLIPTVYASTEYANSKTGIRIAYIICAIIFFAISLVGFLFARMRNKKMRQKYQPHISHYAAQIVACENEIEIYTKQISKLIK